MGKTTEWQKQSRLSPSNSPQFCFPLIAFLRAANHALVGFALQPGASPRRLVSKSAKLVNVSRARCFSAFAPTGMLHITQAHQIVAKFDGKKIDPHTPWSKSILCR